MLLLTVIHYTLLCSVREKLEASSPQLTIAEVQASWTFKATAICSVFLFPTSYLTGSTVVKPSVLNAGVILCIQSILFLYLVNRIKPGNRLKLTVKLLILLGYVTSLSWYIYIINKIVTGAVPFLN